MSTKKLLRVAMVTNYPADPTRVKGGVQAVAARLVEALTGQPGLELHVVHCHSDIGESSVVRRNDVTIHYIAQSRRRVIPNMTTATRLVAGRLAEIAPDVVHAHDSPAFVLAALRAGYSPIWTLHGVTREEERYYPGLFHRMSHALWRRYERMAFARVRELTAVTRYIVDVYETETAGRWHVIENPAPPALFDSAPAAARTRAGPGDSYPAQGPTDADPCGSHRAFAAARPKSAPGWRHAGPQLRSDDDG